MQVEAEIGEILVKTAKTLSTAESCSGGLIAHRITNVAGSSAYFLGGVVAYSNEVKTNFLRVPPEDIDAKGAVSEEVARAMAHGVRERFNADCAIAVTGIAGPTGGTADKPVGLVYISVATPEETRTTRNIFEGDREMVKQETAQRALELLWEMLS